MHTLSLAILVSLSMAAAPAAKGSPSEPADISDPIYSLPRMSRALLGWDEVSRVALKACSDQASRKGIYGAVHVKWTYERTDAPPTLRFGSTNNVRGPLLACVRKAIESVKWAPLSKAGGAGRSGARSGRDADDDDGGAADDDVSDDEAGADADDAAEGEAGPRAARKKVRELWEPVILGAATALPLNRATLLRDWRAALQKGRRLQTALPPDVEISRRGCLRTTNYREVARGMALWLGREFGDERLIRMVEAQRPPRFGDFNGLSIRAGDGLWLFAQAEVSANDYDVRTAYRVDLCARWFEPANDIALQFFDATVPDPFADHDDRFGNDEERRRRESRWERSSLIAEFAVDRSGSLAGAPVACMLDETDPQGRAQAEQRVRAWFASPRFPEATTQRRVQVEIGQVPDDERRRRRDRAEWILDAPLAELPKVVVAPLPSGGIDPETSEATARCRDPIRGACLRPAGFQPVAGSLPAVRRCFEGVDPKTSTYPLHLTVTARGVVEKGFLGGSCVENAARGLRFEPSAGGRCEWTATVAELLGHGEASLQEPVPGVEQPTGSALAARVVWGDGSLVQGSGHGVAVVSPDGSLAATGSFGEGFIRLWNTANGELARWIPVERPVMKLLFSPDSKSLVAEQDQASSVVEVFEAATGRSLLRLPGRSVGTITAQGRIAIKGGSVVPGGEIEFCGGRAIWHEMPGDTRDSSGGPSVAGSTPERDRTLGAPGGPVPEGKANRPKDFRVGSQVPFGVGQTLVTGWHPVVEGAGASVAVLALLGADGALRWERPLDGQTLVTAHPAGGRIVLRTPVKPNPNRTQSLLAVDGAWASDPLAMVPSRAVVLDGATGKVVCEPTEAFDAVLAADARATVILARDAAQAVKILSTARCETKANTGLRASATAVAVSPDGNLIAVGSVIGTVEIRRRATGELVRHWEPPGAMYAIKAIEFSGDGQLVAVAFADRPVMYDERPHPGVVVRRWSSGEEVRGFRPDKRIDSTALVGGAGVAVVHATGRLLFWDWVAGKELRARDEWREPDGARRHLMEDETVREVDHAFFSKDLTRALAPSNHGTARIWNVEESRVERTLKWHDATVTTVAWSADLRSAATGDESGEVRLWDLTTAGGEGVAVEPRMNPAAFTSSREHGVRQLAFSPDGSRIATVNGLGWVRIAPVGSVDGDGARARVYDPRSGGAVATSLAFTPDGKELIVGLSNGTVAVVSLAR